MPTVDGALASELGRQDQRIGRALQGTYPRIDGGIARVAQPTELGAGGLHRRQGLANTPRDVGAGLVGAGGGRHAAGLVGGRSSAMGSAVEARQLAGIHRRAMGRAVDGRFGRGTRQEWVARRFVWQVLQARSRGPQDEAPGVDEAGLTREDTGIEVGALPLAGGGGAAEAGAERIPAYRLVRNLEPRVLECTHQAGGPVVGRHEGAVFTLGDTLRAPVAPSRAKLGTGHRHGLWAGETGGAVGRFGHAGAPGCHVEPSEAAITLRPALGGLGATCAQELTVLVAECFGAVAFEAGVELGAGVGLGTPQRGHDAWVRSGKAGVAVVRHALTDEAGIAEVPTLIGRPRHRGPGEAGLHRCAVVQVGACLARALAVVAPEGVGGALGQTIRVAQATGVGGAAQGHAIGGRRAAGQHLLAGALQGRRGQTLVVLAESHEVEAGRPLAAGAQARHQGLEVGAAALGATPPQAGARLVRLAAAAHIDEIAGGRADPTGLPVDGLEPGQVEGLVIAGCDTPITRLVIALGDAFAPGGTQRGCFDEYASRNALTIHGLREAGAPGGMSTARPLGVAGRDTVGLGGATGVQAAADSDTLDERILAVEALVPGGAGGGLGTGAGGVDALALITHAFLTLAQAGGLIGGAIGQAATHGPRAAKASTLCLEGLALAAVDSPLGGRDVVAGPAGGLEVGVHAGIGVRVLGEVPVIKVDWGFLLPAPVQRFRDLVIDAALTPPYVDAVRGAVQASAPFLDQGPRQRILGIDFDQAGDQHLFAVLPLAALATRRQSANTARPGREADLEVGLEVAAGALSTGARPKHIGRFGAARLAVGDGGVTLGGALADISAARRARRCVGQRVCWRRRVLSKVGSPESIKRPRIKRPRRIRHAGVEGHRPVSRQCVHWWWGRRRFVGGITSDQKSQQPHAHGRSTPPVVAAAQPSKSSMA